MAKIKNVSGEDLLVPGLGDRLVIAGAVVEVPDEVADSYTCQKSTWASAEAATKAQAAAPNNPTKEG